MSCNSTVYDLAARPPAVEQGQGPDYALGKPSETPKLHRAVTGLYVLQVVNYGAPLITLPFLTHMLSATEWGVLAFSQACATYVTLFVEYGFDLSGARDLAAIRSDRAASSELLTSVFLTRSVLALFISIAVFLLAPVIPICRDRPDLVPAILVLGIMQGYNMFWYFQAREEFKSAVIVAATAKVGGMVLLFLILPLKPDAKTALLLSAAPATLSCLAGFALAFRNTHLSAPSTRLLIRGVRRGSAMFIFKLGIGGYASANAFLLGFFVPPESIGYFACGEKLVKGVGNVLGPIGQVMLPRITHLVSRSDKMANRLTRLSLFWCGLIALLSSVTLLLMSHVLVRLLFGAKMAPSVAIVRIMAAVPFLVTVSGILGIQWMLANHLDWLLTRIVVSGGLINIPLCAILAHSYHERGMAAGITITEAFITVAVLYCLSRRRALP